MRKPSLKWDRFYLNLAKFVANGLSKDPSTKCGAVCVNYEKNKEFIGYNGFPIGVNDGVERYNDRETKYTMIVHAEVNAILKAEADAKGALLYVYPSFAIPPICCDCIKIAIQKGIKEIVGYEVDPNDTALSARWKEKIDIARQMADEANIKYRAVSRIK